MLLLKQTLNLSAAVQADTASLHPRAEQMLALVTAGRGPDMAGESLAHVAAEVEVLEQEGVGLGEVVTIANLAWLGIPPDD